MMMMIGDFIQYFRYIYLIYKSLSKSPMISLTPCLCFPLLPCSFYMIVKRYNDITAMNSKYGLRNASDFLNTIRRKYNK